MRDAASNTVLSGAASGRFYVLVLALFVLSACGSTRDHADRLAPPPPAFDYSADPYGGVNAPYTGETPEFIATDLPTPAETRAALNTEKPAVKCGLKDRFDRSATLAYNFTDQSRLALKMSLDGTEVERAMLRFTYKFQKHRDKKAACRVESKVQGLVASVYHELVTRKEDTIWQELRAMRAGVRD